MANLACAARLTRKHLSVRSGGARGGGHDRMLVTARL
jgi:hypothetical protein